MNKTKVLIIDIETTPLVAYSWGPSWETSLIEVIDQTQVLSFSAKWLGGRHLTKGWMDYRGYKAGVLNDKSILKDIWSLLDEADIVIAQNGKAFDVKHLNARFLFHKMTPPSPYKVVDTMIEARKYIKLPSYKLNDVCKYFGIGGKVEHEGFPMWKKCIAGDKEAWKRMLKYNRHDIILTEQLYNILLPFMTNHPNRNLYEGTRGNCPNCSSTHITKRGYIMLRGGRKPRLQCQSCGAWSSGETERQRPL